jgi:hypothetical protein
MKATPTNIASNSNDVSTASVSKASDVMMTSSSQKEGILKKKSTLPNKDPPEGKTTAIVAVMRGRPKHSHHRQHSNKHYKQSLVRVLLDSGSDGNLVFVDKDKPMLLPSLKRLVPQSWSTLNGMFQTKRKAEIKLNFFEYSNSKRYLAEPDIVEYNKSNRPQYDLILGVKTMKKYGIILDFKDKMITVDEVKLPMQNINYLHGSSTLRALLAGICRMSACRPEVQNVRHEMLGPTCRRHVGQHVGDMVQNRVAEGTDMTHPNVGFCDMSAPCRGMHKT